MKIFLLFWKKMHTSFNRIHLIDKCLIVFMFVLLAQSAYNLFVNPTVTVDNSQIDTIIRTSTAAIFGYFLSANFIRGAGEKNQKGCAAKTPEGNCSVENATLETNDTTQGYNGEKRDASSGDKTGDISPCRLQIMIATGMGLFCLISLILLRDIEPIHAPVIASASVTATVAQFRDFVSGCVGFLIGCPTHSSNEKK